MRLFFGVTGLAFLMIGCGSAVILDPVEVEEKSGVVVIPQNLDGAAKALTRNGVTAVDTSKSNQYSASAVAPKVVYFDYDSSVIKPEFQIVIENNARFMKQENFRRIALEGHTDERGGREYNIALGQKRSEAVKNTFRLLGVPESHLEAVSFGKEKPVVSGSDENAMSQNRRVEIYYR